MAVSVLRRGLMGPSEAVLPTMVVDGCRVFVCGCGGGVGLPGARSSASRLAASRTNVGLPRTLASLQGGLAAVRRGVASPDDLRPSV